ncbi:hypothetical protein [Fontivita pretiosa]|uniref:hypothetical protein n=1 Tax=Fontivita pretiosa TaxID=2989684 RepID=UPI003D170A0E
MTRNCMAKAGGAIVGALAVTSGAIGATSHITGNGNFLEVSEGAGGHVGVTQPGTTPSFPYLVFREYTGSAYDIRVFMKVSLSSIPAGSIVTGSQLGIFFTDSTYGTYTVHSDYVDLWSTADEFTQNLSFATYDGTNPWTDGFQAGIDGAARTGPAGRHLDNLWFQGAEPPGTPSNKIINQVQEYKVFSSAALDAYLQQQINAGKDAYFALSIGNQAAQYLRFVSTSDDNTYWGNAAGPIFFNQPYLDVQYVPEPAGAVTVLTAAGGALLARRRRAERIARNE